MGRGTLYAAGSVAEHVGVDHRRRHVAVSGQFLDRADVVAPLEQKEWRKV
jgi:hypothetical protein